MPKKCIMSCGRFAFYHRPENNKQRYCSDHKEEGMKDCRHCEHNRQRSTCKQCGGSSICEHDRQRSTCKQCGGGSICEHDRQRSTCKECGGSAICEHDRIRSACKECGGGSICEHNRIRSECKECGGSAICEHDRIRSKCVTCSPNRACQLCFSVYIQKSRFKPYCFNCYCFLNPDADVPRKFKVKEMHLRDALKEHFPTISMRFDKQVEDGCSKYRPDVLIDDGFPVILECDEHRHSGPEYGCEAKRLMTLFQDLGNRPIRVIRFNPDSYTDDKGVKHKSCFKATTRGLSVDQKEWSARISKLTSVLDEMLSAAPEKEVDIVYLFY